MRDVVQAFKYAGRADCLSPLGRRLARTPRLAFSWDGPGTRAERRRALRVRQGQAHARGADGDWLVVPVPARRESYGRRGYDQAVLLAESLAASAGLDCDPAALRRRRQGRAQAGAPLELRLAQMRAAFQARPGRVAGRPVLLVDDVLSTGATADASARALRLAGSPRVRVVSLAT